MAEDHLQSINECPDCASQNIVHGTMRDQIICRDCGLIFEPFAAAPKTAAKKAAARKAAKVSARRSAMPARKAKPKKARPARKAKSGKGKKKRFGWW